MLARCWLLSCALSTLTGQFAQACTPVQYGFPSGSGADQDKAAAIRQEYVDVWNEYAKYAFGNDTLLPLNQSFTNDLFGWGGSIVDGVDTAIIMGLTDIASTQLEQISRTNFTRSDYIVGKFDAFIRYVAGLLSAYDLINSDLVPANTYKKEHVDALLKAAVTISDKLKPVFNTSTGVPLGFTNFTSGEVSNCSPLQPCDDTIVNTAVSGTFILEWSRLSDLTGDESYRQLAQKAEKVLISPDQKLIYPNLVPGSLDYTTGKFVDFDAGWQSGIDSFYEYLLKTYVYSPSQVDTAAYRDYWLGTVDSTIQHLALHPFGFPNLTFITQLDKQGNPMWAMDDYACFAGGNLLLGGAYLRNDSIRALGAAVTDSCHQTFNQTASGLNPISFSWFNADNKTYANATATPDRTAFFQRAGFFPTNPIWAAFPEPLESVFYAHRITGDARWPAYAWEAFRAIQNDTRRSEGVPFADLADVTAPRGGALVNYVPSYYFAETLKYLYLTFAEPGVVSLDEYVFNTEGHPFKIKAGPCT